jgi:hypothetical protein
VTWPPESAGQVASVRAKIVLDYAFDHCVTVPPDGARYRINYPARFNRLDECLSLARALRCLRILMDER